MDYAWLFFAQVSYLGYEYDLPDMDTYFMLDCSAASKGNKTQDTQGVFELWPLDRQQWQSQQQQQEQQHSQQPWPSWSNEQEAALHKPQQQQQQEEEHQQWLQHSQLLQDERKR